MPIDIAGTILEGGRQRAGTLLKLADIAATNRAQSGQIWAGALNNIGSTVAQMFDPARRQAAEVGRMKVEEAKSQAEDKTALANAFKVGHSKDEVLELLRNSPHSADLIPKVQEMYDQADQRAATLWELKRKTALAEANHLGSLAASVDVWKNDPQSQMFVFDAGLQSALDSGLYAPKHIQQIQEQVHANPQLLSGMIAKLISQSPEQTELAAKKVVDARAAAKDARDAALFEPQLNQAQANASVAQQVAAGTKNGISPQQQIQNAAAAARDAATAAHQKVMEGRPTGATAPVAVMGPDGKPVFVRPEQAFGKQPASTREQGRAVTSGDAGRIADYDTSLKDLVTLRSVVAPRNAKGELIEPGATGTLAKIGTVLPNAVTNLIGWTTPKSKQATIDRVKQVIGKALEGGVLRKEDEYKYEKILPTIYDPVDVVETKLNGLDSAIKQRRQTTLDALEDAGYDVSRFNARTAANVAPPQVLSVGPGRHTFANGQTWDVAPDGKSAVQVTK